MPTRNRRSAVIAVVKNEELNIAEWAVFNLMIGFDAVILYDNSSDDNTKDVILQMAAKIDVRIIDWPYSEIDYQIKAYDDALTRFRSEFDWLAFFDTDEFMVAEPTSQLREILADNAQHPAIAVSWSVFGSGGHVEKPVGLIIENFTRRSDISFPANTHIKVILNPSRATKCVNPHYFAVEGDYVDVAGNTFDWGSEKGMKKPNYDRGKLHHYFVRSRHHWADKLKRGYNGFNRDFSHFDLYDRNELADLSAFNSSTGVRRALRYLNIEPAPAKSVASNKPFLLLTAHGTVCCYDQTNHSIFHAELTGKKDKLVFLFKNKEKSALYQSDLIGKSEIGSIDVVEVGCHIAICLPGGLFLSARQDGSTLPVPWLQAWETYTLAT